MQLPLFPDSPKEHQPTQIRYDLVAGVDEVGRGALFGPVVAAAVLLSLEATEKLQQLGVTDSKKLSAKRRSHLAHPIEELALDTRIGTASVAEIDDINILQASLLAMKRAIVQLNPQPELCLIDGNQTVPDLRFPQQTIVGGDRQSIAIAAASIIAKVWRDNAIVQMATDYPQYDLTNNKGYGTAKHCAALKRYGMVPQHRRLFCQRAIAKAR